MKSLVEVLIAAVDFLKAEGRAAREVLILIALGLVAIAAAAVVVIGGLIFVAMALFFALEPGLGEAWAALVTGLVCLFSAGVMLWIVWRSMNRRRRLVPEDR